MIESILQNVSEHAYIDKSALSLMQHVSLDLLQNIAHLSHWIVDYNQWESISGQKGAK